jgi:alkylation response protein AidB-like acyl-CoA dehydrogenase
MNFRLTEEQLVLRGQAKNLARRALVERAAHWDATAEVPWENIDLLAREGYLGLLVAPEYGGSGGNIMDLVLVLEQFGWACVSTSTYVFGSNADATCIAHLGSPEHKSRYLPGIARGELLPCYAASEPQAGSDAGAIRTSATRHGAHYLLNGQKCWISRGSVSHVFLVEVVFGSSDRNEKGLLIVERGTPGLEIGSPGPLMGQRGNPSTVLTFRDCRVPVVNRMSHADVQSSLVVATLSRCCNAAIALGAAQRAYDEAVDYVQEREAFGKRLADFQGLRWTIADMAVKLDAARLLIYRAAVNAAQGHPSDTEAAMAKTFANEAALSVVSDAMQLFGANGYSSAYPLERLYRDVRGFAIAGGTTQIQRNVIARNALGRRRH